MNLNEKQINFIEDQLSGQGIKNQELLDDLLDHFCCAIEIDMKRGKYFEESFRNNLAEIAPNGLEELENQTRFYLNSKRIIIMKKLMYTSGFIGAFLISMGSLFKIMHWPSANVMVTTGMIAFLFVFVPLFALDRYKLQASKAMSVKFKFFAGLISAFLVGIAVVFKILHLMGADVLLVLGVAIFAFGYLPFLFFSLYKRSVS